MRPGFKTARKPAMCGFFQKHNIVSPFLMWLGDHVNGSRVKFETSVSTFISHRAKLCALLSLGSHNSHSSPLQMNAVDCTVPNGCLQVMLNFFFLVLIPQFQSTLLSLIDRELFFLYNRYYHGLTYTICFSCEELRSLRVIFTPWAM